MPSPGPNGRRLALLLKINKRSLRECPLNMRIQDESPTRQRLRTHKKSSPSVNELPKDKLSVDFHPELLKAWLTLRFNPSLNCFLTGHRPKSNTSRKLSAEELGAGKFEGSAEKAAGELQTILFDIVRSTAKSIPKGERIGVLSSGGIDSTTVMAILCKLGYRPEAYSIGFGAENDEIEAARMAAEFLGVAHHARVLNKILASTVEIGRAHV